jgi:hypothetical protein
VHLLEDMGCVKMTPDLAYDSSMYQVNPCDSDNRVV